MRPNQVETTPTHWGIGHKMSLYSWFNNVTKQDDGYEIGEELPLVCWGRVYGHVQVIERHRKMFSNSYYWIAVRID
jgi:hypothetical protein